MPGAYHERAIGGRVTTNIGLVPPEQGGSIDFGTTFLSLGATNPVNGVLLNIIRNDGKNKDEFPRVVNVWRGRREIFQLTGETNHDALASVNLNSVSSSTEVVV